MEVEKISEEKTRKIEERRQLLDNYISELQKKVDEQDFIIKELERQYVELAKQIEVKYQELQLLRNK